MHTVRSSGSRRLVVTAVVGVVLATVSGSMAAAQDLRDQSRATEAQIATGPGGAYARYEVEHTLTGPVSAVTADFTEPAVDQFVFAVLSVRDADGRWLGSAQQRGPLLVEDGSLGVDLDPALFAGEDGLEAGDVLRIQFGLEMASACPHVNGGTVRFTQLSVS